MAIPCLHAPRKWRSRHLDKDMPRLGPGNRAKIGAAVLAAAEELDTRLVERRLAAFAATHRRYLDAQGAVAATEARLAVALKQLNDCGGEQDKQVSQMARALVGDGQPRANPFRAFRVPSPASMQRLAMAREAALIHRLVSAVQQSPATSQRTRHVAQAAEDAARAVEQALAQIDRLQAAARTKRVARDAIGRSWDRDLATLKLAARAAAADGAPHLHATLFAGVRGLEGRSPRSRSRRSARS
jgi:hypothetical protein